MRLVPAEPHHARLIAKAMRPRDVEEMHSGWGLNPLEAMLAAFFESYHARTLFHDLEPLLMYGLAPLSVLGGNARLWIFASAAIDRHPIAFARASKRCLADAFEHSSLLTNLIDVNDAPAMRWMHWLGGQCVLPSQLRGGGLFAQFILADPHKGARACQRG